MHDKHQAFFDRLAEEWDYTFTAEDLDRLRHLVGKIGVTEGMHILDLGCGTGILFDMLRRAVGDSGSVTGVDFSTEMAQKARRNFPFPNVEVVDADAVALPFIDSTFDMIVAFASFPHFSNQQRALDEAHRVLKAKCKINIIQLESTKEMVEIHHKVGGVVADDDIPSEGTLREMLQKSKFINEQIEDHPGLFLATATNSK